MRRNCVRSAVDPLWVARKGMERGGGDSGRKETAVDEGRKEQEGDGRQGSNVTDRL